MSKTPETLPHDCPGPRNAEGIALWLHDEKTEARAALQGSIVADLSALTTIRVLGAEAAIYMQRLFTGSIRANGTAAECGAWCKPNGRILCLYMLYARDTDDYGLVLPLEQQDEIINKLRLYAINTEVRIETGRDQLLGITGTDGADWLAPQCASLPDKAWAAAQTEDGTRFWRLPGEAPRFILALEEQALPTYWLAAARRLTPAADNAWSLLDVQNTWPRITGTGIGEHLPQTLGLDRLGGLDLDKGCFHGQEVVTRLHYLGRPSRQLYCTGTSEALHTGDGLYNEQQNHCGNIVHSARTADGTTQALAVVRIRDVSDTNRAYTENRHPLLLTAAFPSP